MIASSLSLSDILQVGPAVAAQAAKDVAANTVLGTESIKKHRENLFWASLSYGVYQKLIDGAFINLSNFHQEFGVISMFYILNILDLY